MITRETLEGRERDILAPYAAKAADSRGREHPESEPPYRTRYQRDKDRIIHCGAFRRLEYKTQVFVNHEGDYFRTRLTHTMEVVQISRTMARTLGVNEDLAEAIALAHDLGHTPFGHSGEDALRELMADHGGFEHNRHGLRVVEHLEKQYQAFAGLNLTWEVRESMVKHATGRRGNVPEEYAPGEMPLMEAQLVELADSIAYDSHDVDDGLKGGLIEERQLREVPLWGRGLEAVGAETEREPALVRSCGVRGLIHLVVTDLLERTTRNIEQMGISSPEDVRGAGRAVVELSAGMRESRGVLERFLQENVYRHYRVVRMCRKARRFLVELFGEYCDNPGELPPAFQSALATTQRQRVTCDYIAGMTDRYAQDEYMRLFTPYERV